MYLRGHGVRHPIKMQQQQILDNVKRSLVYSLCLVMRNSLASESYCFKKCKYMYRL